MLMKSTPRQHRQTLALRQDLADRVHQTAALISQNPNYFVNKCVEGCLDAMESEELAVDIPIVVLVRKMCGRPELAAKWVPAICALLAPHSLRLTPRHYRHFADLIDGHEGPRTQEAVQLYWRLADTRTEQQVAFEDELRALKQPERSTSANELVNAVPPTVHAALEVRK